MEFLRKFFDTSKRDVDQVMPVVNHVNDLEPAYAALSDDEIRTKFNEFKAEARNGANLDTLMPDVFAIVREAGKRTLGMRLFDVQIIGAAVLHRSPTTS